MFKILPIIVAFFLFNSTFGQTDNEILSRTITKLKSLKTIEYDLTTHEISNSRNQNKIDSTYCYFDFTSKDSLIQTKYQFTSKYGEYVYNGSQFFNTLPSERVLIYEDKPSERRVTSLIFMLNSIYGLRKSLPNLILDKGTKFNRVNDTIINNFKCFKFNIITNKQINLDGSISKLKDDLKYVLCISKNDYTPIQFGLYFAKDDGYRISTFSNFKNINQKSESTLDYNSRFLNYRKSTFQDYFKSMRYSVKTKIGLIAPDWKLPLVSGDSIKLSNSNKKLILLEFFFPYCKGCVEASPEIDNINATYKKEGLLTYGIEFTNKDSGFLADYIKKQGIQIPILYNGKNVSKEYEVFSAPTFFLINSEGTILYASSGFNKDALIQKIEENIH